MERIAIESKLKEITDKIVREFQPEKIILFGSWAWGEPQESSDVDLFVMKKSGKSRIERGRELRRLLSGSGFPSLDILVYTPEEVDVSINQNRNLFIEDVVRNGRVLYARSSDDVRIADERPLVILAP